MKNPRLPDPRCVFVLAAYLSLFAVFIQSLWLMIVLVSFAFLVSSLIGAGLKKVFYQLKRLWQVVFVVAFLNSVFSPYGKVLIKLGNVVLLTSGGLAKGSVVLCRLVILILSGSLFTLYESGTLIQAMIRMRLPYEIAYMISVGLRFVPMMGQELRDSLVALALRGVVVEELSFIKRIKVYVYLLLPMVAGCLNNARELSMSMETRGFGAYAERTSYLELELNRRDYLLLTAIVVLAALTGIVILVL